MRNADLTDKESGIRSPQSAIRNPVVSVIIPNWNRRDLLRGTLRSLSAQTFPDAEVIVVDNGSTDGSAGMVLAEFPKTVLIRNAENLGYCKAINQGIRQARGRYVALLNNDAEADRRWLEELVAGAAQAPEVGMCASKILVFENREVIDKVGHLIYPDGQNRGRGCGERDRGQYDRPEEVLLPDGCAALYDRRVFETAGMFDEDFFAYADDAELGLRVRLAGWRCLYVPTALVYHHHSSTLGRFSPDRIVLVERNRLWLAAKLFPWRLLVLNPFYSAIRLGANLLAALGGVGEAGQFARHEGVGVLLKCTIRAYIEALAGLPRIFRKRREIRRWRRLSNREFLNLLRRYRISARELAFQSIPARENATMR